MTPDPDPTPTQRAEELDRAADIAAHHQDLVFCKECQDRAEYLRQQEAIKCGTTQSR